MKFSKKSINEFLDNNNYLSLGVCLSDKYLYYEV